MTERRFFVNGFKPGLWRVPELKPAWRKSLLFIICWLILSSAGAQAPADSNRSAGTVEVPDSLGPGAVGTEQPDSSKPAALSDTIAVFLLRHLEDLAVTLNQINQQLQTPLDSNELELDRVDRELRMIEAHYVGSEQKAVNFRILNSINAILGEIKTRLTRFEDKLLTYNQRLIDFESSIEDIERDTVNRLLPGNAALRSFYLTEINQLTQRYQQVDELVKYRLLELGLMQNRLTRLSIRTNDLIMATERRIGRFRSQMLRPEHPSLRTLTPAYYQADLREVLSISLSMAGETLGYFFRFNWGIRLINISFVLFLYFFARTMLARIRRKHQEDAAAMLSPASYFNHYPAIGALVAGLTLVPFLYGTPPLAFVEIIWFFLFTLMSWLLSKRFARAHFRLWLGLLVLFVINGCVIMMITTTYVERWALFVVNLLSVGLGIGLLTEGRISRTPAPRYWLSRIVFWLFLVMNVLALAANWFGFFDLAIILSYAGNFQVLYVMALWVFIELMGELTYLYIEANKEKLESYSLWLDYQDLQQRLKRILGLVAVILWLGAFLKSLNVFDMLYGSVYQVLSQPRSIGNFTFTYVSLLIFLAVIYASVLISRLLAYLFGNHGMIASAEKKNNLGSTMLLVRIAVLAAGFLVALSAAGISLDRVAIVLGALGVGIGFGLQTIVNNLVSGIILAFEKPIKIGDVIELGTFVGKVKEIGIRSSKVATFDGADVIIPNGDLLSQQLTNWTLSNYSRRIELIVGVGYGSDIRAVREAIQRAINSREKILHYPPPLVLVNQFSDSSVQFRVLFWTNRFDEWISIKSDMMEAIYDELNHAGIEIPFPKRDVFIHMPEEKGPLKNFQRESGRPPFSPEPEVE